MLCGNSAVGFGNGFAIQRVKNEIAVLVNQTSNSVDELEP